MLAYNAEGSSNAQLLQRTSSSFSCAPTAVCTSFAPAAFSPATAAAVADDDCDDCLVLLVLVVLLLLLCPPSSVAALSEGDKLCASAGGAVKLPALRGCAVSVSAALGLLPGAKRAHKLCMMPRDTASSLLLLPSAAMSTAVRPPAPAMQRLQRRAGAATVLRLHAV
jgi:hypothetical protein